MIDNRKMGWILENSIFLKEWENLKEAYLTMEAKISYVYLESFAHQLIKKINEAAKIYFRYSFFGRITETEQATPMALDNSRAVRYLINFYKRWESKVIDYLRTSSVIALAKDIREELIFSSVRMISLIIIIVILVNAVLAIILQKQMGLWSFFIRVLFLFAGTAGLSCEADWQTVKNSSIFLRNSNKN